MTSTASDASPAYDCSPAALKPLIETFWSVGGWRRLPVWPEPEVMRGAVRAGVMFDASRTEDHDGWVAAARHAVRQVNGQQVADAFVASLTTGRLDLRSALGSFVMAAYLPEHRAEPMPSLTGRCAVCGQFGSDDGGPERQDLNVMSFKRFKFGGTAVGDIRYAAFDLEQFVRAPQVIPSNDAVDLGRRIIDELRVLPRHTTAAEAASKHLRILRGNTSTRRGLLEVLGMCGILNTGRHPGFADGYVHYADRRLPPKRFVDMSYPACWWTAANGIDEGALRRHLPRLA
jgi:hypothetical protein